MLLEKINVMKRIFFIQSRSVKSSGTFLNWNVSSELELDPLPQEKIKKEIIIKIKLLISLSIKILNKFNIFKKKFKEQI
tara:strand:+ start:183 stop:419 length:237 start_codon:yes stop_codon:yes gene_type:complete